MSKCRLQGIQDGLMELLHDDEKVQEAVRMICAIMKFDPDEKQYTPEKGQATLAWRKKKAAELGVTEYAISTKKYYERKKLKDKAEVDCQLPQI